MNLETMASPNDSLGPVTVEAPAEQPSKYTFHDYQQNLNDAYDIVFGRGTKTSEVTDRIARRMGAEFTPYGQGVCDSFHGYASQQMTNQHNNARVWDLPDPAVKGAEKMKAEAISRLVSNYRVVGPGGMRDGIGIALEVIKTLDPAKVAE
jgi:hypothetical protein